MQPHIFGASAPVEIAPGVSLVTKADLQGRITYANPAFVQVSGYTLPELVGSPHSIVRHPDMPPAVFAAMWTALRNGMPWQGLLHNRSKTGQSFWVNACIVPIQRAEQTTGYMAVFERAAPEEVAAATHSAPPTVAAGVEPFPGRLALGVKAGMHAGFAFVALLILAGGLLGIGGLHMSDKAFDRLYHQQFEPAGAVSQVEARLGDVRAALLQLQPSATGVVASNQGAGMESLLNAFDEIHETFARVPVQAHAGDAASTALAQALQQYTTEGRALINRIAAEGDTVAPAVQQQLGELQNKAQLSAQALRQALTDSAQEGFAQTLQRNDRIRKLAIAGMLLGLLLLAVVGHQFVRSIVEPLNLAIRRLNRIAEGDVHTAVPLSGVGETARLNQAALVMQQHLKVMIDEIAVAARAIHQHCQAMNQSLYEVTEHSEAQHDQVHAARRALGQAVGEISDLSLRAEQLMEMADSAASGEVADNAQLVQETQELATATRLTVFGAEQVAASMQQVAELIVENRSQAQLAWQASEAMMRTAQELNQLVAFFAPPANRAALDPEASASLAAASSSATERTPEGVA